MHFGEYELSPGLIGLSPLPSAHWNTFQRIPIRTSIRCYPDFILAKGRSPGFASTPADSTPSSDSLSLRLHGSCRLTSPARVTRRFIMQKARRHPTTGAPTACRRTGSGSVSLPCSGFFSPFPHGTGSLSVSREYLALPDGPGRFTRDSSCPALLRIPSAGRVATCKGLSPATAALSRGVPLATRPAHDGPTTPSAPRRRRFGLLRFRSPLLAESLLFSPPVGT